MRVNVYNEEFPNHVVLTKRTADVKGQGMIGVRFYLPPERGREDTNNGGSERHAITFWLKDRADRSEMSDGEKFCCVLLNAVRLIEGNDREQQEELRQTPEESSG